MSSPKLALYYFESCPFCVMVINLINQLNLDVEFRDIFTNQDHLNKLMSDTGKRTVPCLYIDNKPMFESSDIMAWLEENSSNLSKKA
ncbi:MAG: NrdH-redoxin [Halobacteriovorax sp.]|nr:NrdH-redoxin [Halobacteriovorax sp.]|tara:strand:+ start:556 stop:816 length:261 start_codon:yes stop_codon:yes gene_type:complete